MLSRVRVRRDRPSALSWAVALAVTMLAVYLVTLSSPKMQQVEDASAAVRVTSRIDFEGMTVYFIDLGVHPDEWQARVAAAGYASRGAAGMVYENADGFHVLGAGYALESDAERIAARLSGQPETSANVIELSGPAVSIRVTAPEGDAEAISEADRALRTQLSQLSAIALQLDRGEITSASARTLVRVAASEVRSARKRLEKVGGWEDQPVCTSLSALLRSMEKNLAACTGTGAELSGLLRCCHADGMLKLIAFLNNPGGA